MPHQTTSILLKLQLKDIIMLKFFNENTYKVIFLKSNP